MVSESRYGQMLFMADGVHDAKPKICPNNIVDDVAAYDGSMMAIVKIIKGKNTEQKGPSHRKETEKKEEKNKGI